MDNQEGGAQQLTYMPAPPPTPEVAKPGQPPSQDSFYVPGQWTWHDAGYVVIDGREVYRDAGYAWTAGYWARVQPGYVWVPAHYRWTPSGSIYIAGYWDLAIAKRGVLYAPVYVDAAIVGPAYVYTPAYAVSDTILVDAMFVRPCYCHYYFGDYYGVVYKDCGFESCVVFGRAHYDPIFVYATWEHRYEPSWINVQLDLTLARHAGRAPLPPRTLVQQNTIIQNNVTNVTNVTNINRTTVSNAPVLVPSSQLSAATGIRTVPVDNTARLAARQQAQAVQQVALNRSAVETASPAGHINQPRVASLNMPAASPGSKSFSSSSGIRGSSLNSASSPSFAHPAGPAGSARSFTPSSPRTPNYVPPSGRPGSNPMPGASAKGPPGKGPTQFRSPFQGRPAPRPGSSGDKGEKKQ
jgi:hypothetical protein